MFPSPGKNKLHMYIWTTQKYNLCDFRDSTYKLNALIFVF